MPLYECNEHQFVENIRRLMETSERFVVNRKMELRDDANMDHQFYLTKNLIDIQQYVHGNPSDPQFSRKFHS
ncbi:MAG: hypothetical protein ACJ706_09795 [Nitrososphaeraceae archaeon]